VVIIFSEFFIVCLSADLHIGFFGEVFSQLHFRE
jgi:hypothetical protein